MKYNYVFYNMRYDYLQYLYVPLEQEENVLVHRTGLDSNRFINAFFNLHWSHKINKKCNLPLKKIWFKKMYANPFQNGKPICFVFMGGKYISQSKELRRYIHKNNPNNRCVIYCGDLIKKKDWNVEWVKKNCDAIVTYDPGEAKKYGIYCYSKPLYGRIAPATTPDSFEYDVYYLGFAKGRLLLIRKIYHKLVSEGLKCKFIVCGVKQSEQLTDGIEYGEPISYRENIDYVNRSKCILELIQEGSSTGTLRREESIIYKRKLLTNYIGMEKAEYFNRENMSVFSNADEIDIEFIRKPINYNSFMDESELAPINLLKYIERILEEQ